MTNLILIDATIPQLEQFTNSVNNSSRYIVYNINDTFADLVQKISDFGANKYSNLAFVFQDNGSPLKMFVAYNNFIAYDQNGVQSNSTTQFIKQLVETYQIKCIDFLACNLLRNPTWKSYFEFIIKDNDNNVVVRASDNQTGNSTSGGDWILETTGNDVREVYFTDQIEHWKYLLDYQSTLTAFISNCKLWVGGKDNNGMMGIGTDETLFQNINKDIGKNIIAVACGNSHTAILTNETINNLYTCGSNNFGQLGTGDNIDRNIFVQTNIGKRVTAVDCGSNHTAILTNDSVNNLYTCGNNNSGGLGIGNTTSSNVFLQTNIGKRVIAVACGDRHTAILTDEIVNNLYTCGYNNLGQLGIGDVTNRNTFIRTTIGKLVTAVACGLNHTAILTSVVNDPIDNLYSCGNNIFGQLGTGNNTSRNIFVQINIGKTITTVDCGRNYTAILTDETVNNLYTCGYNLFGQLGIGNTTSSNTFIRTTIGKTITRVACGYYHTAILTDETANNLYTCGDNINGGLGTGDKTISTTFIPPINMTDKTITSLSCGNNYSAILTDDLVDNLYTCGYNNYGQLGSFKKFTQASKGIYSYNIIVVACGVSHTAILTDETVNNLYICGNNKYGGLGVGSTDNSNIFVKTNIGKTITAVACGQYHTVILTDETVNNLYTCGYNSSGQLGTGNTTSSNTFIRINIDKKVTAVDCGDSYTAILTDEIVNNLYTCGSNFSGQLGIGNTTNSNTFIRTNIGKLIVAVACGDRHTAILSDEIVNNLYTCGSNLSGELGIGNTTNSNTFIQTNIGKLIKTVACGRNYTAILTDETINNLYTCGVNRAGQLGVGNNTNSNIFIKTNMDKLIIAVACGGYHTAIATNETANNLYTCGDNYVGQLGTTENNINHNTFIRINIGKTITSVACGIRHTAILTDEPINNLYTCGANYDGQLGTCNTDNRNILMQTNIGKTITAVACGGSHTAILTDETVDNLYTCGYNIYGELGIGDNINYNIFKKPTNMTNKTISAIACGYYHTAILTNETTDNLYTCGLNSGGQLGLGDTDSRNIFIRTNIGKQIKAVACGVEYTSVLTAESVNNLYTCGSNSSGQLGIGNTNGSNTFIQTNIDKTITAVACGGSHTAILTNETINNLYSCGDNNNGQLGIGNYVNSNTFIRTNIDKTIIAVACSLSNTAILTDETTNNLYICGNNNYGQLGIGNNTDSNIFVPITDNKTIIAVAFGQHHTTILTNETSNNLYSCGDNSSGQLITNLVGNQNRFIPSAYTDKVTYISGLLTYRSDPILDSPNFDLNNATVYYSNAQDFYQNTLTADTNVNGNTTIITFGPPGTTFSDYIKYSQPVKDLQKVYYQSSASNSQPILLTTTPGGDAYYNYDGTTLTIFIRHFSDIIIETNSQTNGQAICFHPDSQLLVERDNILQWLPVCNLQKGDILTDDKGRRLNIIKLHITKKTNAFVQISNNMWITSAHLLKNLANGHISHSCKFPLPMVEKECENTYHIETDGSQKYHFIPVQMDTDDISSEYGVEVWGKKHKLSKKI